MHFVKKYSSIQFIIVLLTIIPMALFAQKDSSQIFALINKSRNYIIKPGNNDTDLSAALSLAQQALERSNASNFFNGIGNSYLVMAEAYREKGDRVKGRMYSKLAMACFRKSGSLEEQAKATIEYGGTFNNESEISTKIALYKKGAQLFHEANAILDEAVITQFVADLYILNGASDSAIHVLDYSLDLYKKVNYKRLQGVYSLYGQAYNLMNQFGASLKFNLLAARIGEEQKDEGPLMATIYNRLGLIYFNIGYYNQAMDYFNKGLRIAKIDKDTVAIILLQNNITDGLYKKNEFRKALQLLNVTSKLEPLKDTLDVFHNACFYFKILVGLKDFSNANYYFLKVQHLLPANAVSSTNKLYGTLISINYLQESNQYSLVNSYLNMAKSLMNKLPFSVSNNKQFEFFSYKYDSAFGNFKGALEHYKNFKLASDSAFNINKVREFDQLEVQSEHDRLDQDIQFLMQKNQLNNALLNQEKNQKNIFLISLFVFLLLSALLFLLYRNKLKSNIVLEQKQAEINERNLQLSTFIKEKEWLLKEVHHRVKNNLQIVISLLNSQLNFLKDAEAIAAIKSSQQRMYAISLIHQLLYQDEKLGQVEICSYIKELVAHLKTTFDDHINIRFDLHCQHLLLDVVQAVPLGLILNEAVSNAVKYAFPNKTTGIIEISLQSLSEKQYLLSVQDNGIGMADNINYNSTLGMNLMHGLAGQLGGELNVENKHDGVLLRVNFKVNYRSTEL
ncbi:histidine kinase dimerization/phosphoacceptor domain -containing protein [Rhizosphaericola mali]|uniref:histidine kinase n=1 Tax=Rhizosphaericola mali TaxID=2545455 RepID=A0A5P2G8K9_9BACT|nr:histidine kinase dimerization/phosphoacceptor domain -containing protein [Rhizosphaericola mali]QES90080.1 hypothetical protein E0W69_015930 [Rhizosphaericola mali]